MYPSVKSNNYQSMVNPGFSKPYPLSLSSSFKIISKQTPDYLSFHFK